MFRRILTLTIIIAISGLLASCDLIVLEPQAPPQPPSGGPAQPPPQKPNPAPPPNAQPPAELSARGRTYLEQAVVQTERLQKAIGQIGGTRLSTGALSAAALADRQPAKKALVARWANEALTRCSGKWSKAECERGRLRLQRLVLSYPETLPRPLLGRLKAAVGSAPPAPARGGSPWAFSQTENQRIVTIAAALSGLVVGGRAGSPAAKGWSAEALEFLEAHDRQGWYEADSPGYIAISIDALLMLADFAPDRRVRDLASRQLNLLFAAWAQEQVAGFPAGAKTRAYVHWALNTENTPWAAWYWLLTGRGDSRSIKFLDAPDLVVSSYRVPATVVSLAANRRRQAPYEVLKRRAISPQKRRNIDAAIRSYATPDYILSTSQAVDGLRLGVSGGQEIAATLMPEGDVFAPLYLWSRTSHDRSNRWRSWAENDLAASDRNVVLAQLNGAAGKGGGIGHVYFAPAWGQPRLDGDRLAARVGSTYVALRAVGGWRVVKAVERFPDLYGGDRNLRQAWVAVARRQPARIAMEVGRAAEHGSFTAFLESTDGSKLTVVEGRMQFAAESGARWTFVPGRKFSRGSQAISAQRYPLLKGPFLRSETAGGWRFTFEGTDYRFKTLR